MIYQLKSPLTGTEVDSDGIRVPLSGHDLLQYRRELGKSFFNTQKKLDLARLCPIDKVTSIYLEPAGLIEGSNIYMTYRMFTVITVETLDKLNGEEILGLREWLIHEFKTGFDNTFGKRAFTSHVEKSLCPVFNEDNLFDEPECKTTDFTVWAFYTLWNGLDFTMEYIEEDEINLNILRRTCAFLNKKGGF